MKLNDGQPYAILSAMRHVSLYATLALCLIACGEGSTEPACTERVEVVEVVYDSPLRDAQEQKVADMETDGWTCGSAGHIRNAFGKTIGERIRCTICW